ncbi:RNA polymerase III subunit E [Leptinotarsa decemlineata]|uniref:RNA polymerase III subunit E n=1 Tax=Leptinotarsa decemlineata TaxID=7539 RepID=UPI000C254528|nr:DNA-directed RNA polymerase III subunit RPC5 [Leptinotarsa decemlineata]
MCDRMDGMESDEDDPVVREIPIIHSTRLEETLHLFQYPLKSSFCINQHNIRKCFIKPQNREVKLELGIDIDSPNFDSGKAEFIAEEVDGNTNNPNEKYFESGLVDKVFLQSTRPIEDPNKYAAAVYNGREIHLTALKDAFQFRPTFPYMEKGLKRKKTMDTNDSDEEAGPSTVEKVTVKFKSNDERWKKNENSYKTLKDRSAEEPWIECSWHNENSVQSNVERLKLISDNTEDTVQANYLTDSEYIKLLIPENKEKTPLEPSLPSHMLSLHALRELPVLEQCRLLLKDAQIIQFQQLLLLLTGGPTADVLLKTLPNVANLVRGNWVVKSEVLYPANTLSATCGVPAESMCRARDYVLYLFTKNQFVERKKVSPLLKIPSEEIKRIFEGISRLRLENKKWELLLPSDVDFINKHTDLVQKQNLLWEHRFHQLSEYLKDNKSQRRKSRSESKSISEDGKPKNIPSSDDDSGTEKSKTTVGAKKKNLPNSAVK